MEFHILGTGNMGWEGVLVILNIYLSQEPLPKARACAGHVHFPAVHSRLPAAMTSNTVHLWGG